MNEKRIAHELSAHPDKYSSHYSEEGFLKKITRLTKKKSLNGVINAYILYYTISAPTTPKWVILEIVPCMGYFVFPLDLIPDILIGIGFVDDIAAFGITLKLMSGTIRNLLHDYATPSILLKAMESTKALFKDVPEDVIRDIINSLNLYEPI